MPPRKPASVTAAGVLAIIYGSLALLCGFCGLAGQAVQGAMGPNFMNVGGKGGDAKAAEDMAKVIDQIQKDVEKTIKLEIPLGQTIDIVGMVLNLILGGIILVGGIGLVNMGRWARTLTSRGCLISIALFLFQIIFLIAKVMPVADEALQEFGPKALQALPAGAPPPEEIMNFAEIVVKGIFIVGIIFHSLVIIYLLTIVGLLSRRHVRAAFANLDKPGIAEHSPHEERPPQGYEEDQDWNKAPPQRPPDDPNQQWGIK